MRLPCLLLPNNYL